MKAFVCDRCHRTVNEAGIVKSWANTESQGSSYDLSRDLCKRCYDEFKDWIARSPAEAA